MKYIFPMLAALFVLQTYTSAQALYVSGSGNDDHDGRTPATALRSLQKAAGMVQPGDVVWIGNGVYTNEDKANGSAVLSISRSGRPGAWITWKAQAGQHPEVRPGGWAGIQISGSYHIIDGLTVTGGNDSIVLLQAQEDAKKTTPDPRFNTNGIFVNGRSRTPEEKPHHIVVRNCTVSKCPGGGITAIESDYITIEDCRVSDNAWFMRYGGSGITTLNSWAFDDAPGYHMIIRRNFVWNNKTMVQWTAVGKLSDGNGILLDVTDREQGAANPNADPVLKTAAAPPAKPERPEWTGHALIANNISAYNGGSGIHTFRTRNVDIINNTTYCNGSNVGYAELFANHSENITILNNIIVPRPGGQVTSQSRNTNIRWDYNLYPKAQQIYKAPHDIIADPGFIHVRPDLMEGNFHLAKNSPALNSGTNDLAQPTDISGKTRPQSTGRDRGAFEQ